MMYISTNEKQNYLFCRLILSDEKFGYCKFIQTNQGDKAIDDTFPLMINQIIHSIVYDDKQNCPFYRSLLLFEKFRYCEFIQTNQRGKGNR